MTVQDIYFSDISLLGKYDYHDTYGIYLHKQDKNTMKKPTSKEGETMKNDLKKMTQNTAMLSFLLGLLLLGLLTTNMTKPSTSHGNEPISEYEGPTIIIPYFNGSASIDGIVSEQEYPEPGHLTLEGFPEELKFKHNGTHLIVGISQDSAKLVGLGIHPQSGHEEELKSQEFAYFIASLKNATTSETKVVISDQAMESVEVQLDGDGIISASISTSAAESTFEMVIPLGIELEVNSQGNSGEHVEMPTIGSIFHAVIMYSSEPTIQDQESMSHSGLVPMYLVRPGEDIEKVTELFEKKPNWIQAAVIPSILLLLTAVTVYNYLPRKK